MDILDGESSDDDPVTFKINKNYAKSYDTWRKNEERQKLLDRYGEDADQSSSSTEEEEIRSTKQMDKDWLRTYAVIHFKQPRLYKEGATFFHDEATPDTLKKKEKATTLKDHERKFILEKGGVESDDESKPISMGKSYFEEQEEIKESLKVAIGDVKEEEDEGFLIKKEKSDSEQRQEENDYLEWLKGEREELMDKDAAAELAPLKAYWNDPSLSEKEKVLRDYILNNGYMDDEDSDDSEGETEAVKFAEEEEFLEKAEVYEHKYNFRHEEPGADEIKSYPRVIETSVRNKNTTRAEKRKRRAEKKNLEKEKRNEEVRLLQKLQMEQRREKMDRLKQIAKNPRLEYDLEEDFDPEKHDKIMQEYFDEEYYGEGPSQKPEFEYDPALDGDDEGDGDVSDDKEDVTEKYDEGHSDNGDEEEPGVDDPNFNMDADYDPDEDYESEQIRKKKYGKAFAKKLPLFDPKTKTFDEYIDEFLRDKINTLPFTYREVMPNSFGLSTEEILKAPVRELNSWVSVKKMSQYRSKSEELADKKKFAARASLPEKKFKVLPSLLKKPEVTSNKGSKKKKKRKATDEEKVNGSEDVAGVSSKEVKSEKRYRQEDSDLSVIGKKRKKMMEDAGSLGVKMTSDTEAGGNFHLTFRQADGSKKKKQKLLEGRISEAVLDTNVSNNEQQEVSPPRPKKKKKVLELEEGHVCGSGVKKTKLNSSPAKVDAASMQKANTKGKKIHNDIPNDDAAALDSLPAQSQVKYMKKSNSKSLSKNKELKKSSKKKVSISNFSKKKGSSDVLALGSDPKKIKQTLSQVMSMSRLSNYGIGPTKGNKKQKTKKKKKKQSAQ